MGKHKVLFVDDEQYILDTFRASLRKRYDVDTALGPLEALKRMESSGPYAVVVSDLKMPEMDGIRFLGQVHERYPDTVRVMLTGHADLESAIDAVNKGEVFRFLTKPTPIEDMIRTLEIALRQYSLVVAERELLRGTLRGSVKMLTDILALVNPPAFGKSERVKRLALYVGQNLHLKSTLHLELAAMLSQVGCVIVPDAVMEKVETGKPLSVEELGTYATHPSVAASLLANIPRMERVSDIILRQNDRLSDNPTQPVEARILKACLDYDELSQQGVEKFDALDTLRRRAGWYDAAVLGVLERGVAADDGYLRRELNMGELRPGMILDDALYSLDGIHIMARGMELSETALLKLNNFIRSKRLPERIRVLVPLNA